MVLLRGRKENRLIPDGPLGGYNKNYESKFHTFESYLYRKYIIAMIIQGVFFKLKKKKHFLSQMIKQLAELQITMSISSQSAV